MNGGAQPRPDKSRTTPKVPSRARGGAQSPGANIVVIRSGSTMP